MFKKALSKFFCLIRFPYFYGKTSFSQEGEDLILEHIFNAKKKGFYLDIGSYHPYKYSNTQKLYQKGWYGINIDANSESIELFKSARVRDVNITAGIGGKKEKIQYFLFKDSALNTFNEKVKNEVLRSGQSTLIGKKYVNVYPITYIFKKYVKNKRVDFLNIDCEGESFNILTSIKFKVFHPKVVAIERENMGRKITKDKVIVFMENVGYSLVSATNMTYIFIYSV